MAPRLIKIQSKIAMAFVTLLVIFLAVMIVPIMFGTLAVRNIFGLKTIDYPAEPYSEESGQNCQKKN